MLIANGSTTVNALVTGNTIRQYTNTHGILIHQGDGTTAKMNATVRGNTLSNPNDSLGGAGGVTARAGLTSTPAAGGGPDAGTMCLDLGGSGALQNALATAGTELAGTGTETEDIFAWQRFSAKIQLPGLGATTTDAAARSYLQARNAANGLPTVYTESTPENTGFPKTNSSCPTP